jgi:HAD superfamily hydrolase (TIGR01509 family)
MTGQPRRAVLYDVDGTLVDSSYLHVVAWWEAFRSQGHDISMTDIHRCIGMGSDSLVESLLDQPNDDAIEAHTDYYAPRLRQLRTFPDATKLLRRTHDEGLVVILATSASDKEAAHLRTALDADDVIDHMTTSEDAENAKPAADILLSAMKSADVKAENCIFVGDSVWDIKACARIDMPCIALLSGGISESELTAAGAVAVYRDPAHLLAEFDDAVLARLTAAAGRPGGLNAGDISDMR